LSRLYNTFEFVGNIQLPKDNNKFHDVKTSDSGWEGHRLNYSIQESKTNSVYLENYGGFSKAKQNRVLTFGKGTENVRGGKLEIPWEDRLKDETVQMVADFKKIVVDFTTDQEAKEKANRLRYEIRTLEYKDELTDSEQSKVNELRSELKEVAPDRHEFIHEYDVVVFLANKLEDYKNHKFRVTGSIALQEWKGKFHRKFRPELIEIVDNDTPSKLTSTMDIFFTKDAVDEKDFAKDKKIYIDGYVLSYDERAKKDQFFPTQFVINAGRIDLENPEHVSRLNFLKNQFTVKGKGVFHLPWQVNIFRGADKVEFTEKDLTQKQREAIEFGYAKLEDYAPKGGMLGESVFENRLVKPLLQNFNDHNNFVDGAVETSYSVDDLDYVPVQQEEKKPEQKEAYTPPPAQENKPKVDLEDLFG
jgi:hypothetical protein